MNAEIKAQWVAALRSGRFKAGRQRLAYVLDDEIYYCCLGVLCELAFEARAITTREVQTENNGLTSIIFGNNHADMFLSPDVATWAGLNTIDPIVSIMHVGEILNIQLSKINDHYGKTFAGIADAIESSDI